MQPHSDAVAGRFEPRRHLGTGGFGEVWEVWDRERAALVARKRLSRVEPRAVLHFKHEFRALAGISHPNLAQLYELIADDEEWSFTMELVRGQDFVSAVAAPPATGARYDEQRLRDALQQLVHGLAALHAAGSLHGDVKPQNVLVEADGRVVILDFGMVRGLGGAFDPTAFSGTPHYMAPEQAGRGRVTAAADWYAVGVMLFEVLTGHYPVDGNTVVQLFLRKQTAAAPTDDAFPADTPVDLRQACQKMLALDPGDRPSHATLLAMLGVARPAIDAPVMRDPDRDAEFVGRADLLAALDGAFSAVADRGKAQVMALTGPSGIGKSALATHFVRGRPSAEGWALQNQCGENESVPFKALDGIVDDLVDRLRTLDDDAVGPLLGPRAASLARVFPSLTRLPQLADLLAEHQAAPASPQLRFEAFRALRDLLRALSTDRVCTFLIDDAQWGDLDSAQALGEILDEPDGLRILIVLTCRDGQASDSEFVRALRAGGHIEVLEVGRLSHHEAVQFALRQGAAPELAEKLARETNGDPYLIQQLVSDDATDLAGTVEDAVRRRVATLSTDEQVFLEAFAVAHVPLDPVLVREACGAGSSVPQLVARLRNGRLLRAAGGGRAAALELYHDRLRQTVVAALSEDRRRHLHLRLAQTLERAGWSEPDTLAQHFRAGGELVTSARYAWQAAERATQMLAYEHAARAYAEALRDGQWSDEERETLNTRHGTVLAYLGRGAEAAEAFIRAAAIADSVEAVALRCRGAEQLLRSGQFVRGRELLEAVLQDLGTTPPRSPARLNAALAWEGTRAFARGTRFELRTAPLEPLESARLETLWAASNLMATLDVKWGFYYTLLNLRASLDSGDPECIARTLALQAVQKSARHQSQAQAARLLDAAAALVEHVDDATVVESVLSFMRGMAAYMTGDVRASHQLLNQAARGIAHLSRFAWEQQFIQLYDFHNLYHLGEFGALQQSVRAGSRAAALRDDLMQWSAIVTWGHLVHLIADDPQAAIVDIDRAAAAWRVPGAGAFLLQDFWRLCGEVRAALYTSRYADALHLIETNWGGLRRGFLLALDLSRGMILDFRARAHLGLARDGEGTVRQRSLRAARADARRLRGVKQCWATAMADVVEAQAAALEGDQAQTLTAYARAEVLLAESGHELLLAAVRARVGHRDDMRRAHQWFTVRGVVDPIRFIGMIIPVGGERE